MADLYGLEASGLPPELVAKLAGVQGRRKIAESMLQRGMTPIQVPQGTASWTQALAQLANAYIGRKGLDQAEEEAQGIANQRKAMVSEALANYEKQRMGQAMQTAPFEADTFPGEAPMQGLKTITKQAVAPDKEAAYRGAMMSAFPELQKVATTDYNIDAKKEAREDQQAFQKDQLKAQTEARAADRAAQREATMERVRAEIASRESMGQQANDLKKYLGVLQAETRKDIAASRNAGDKPPLGYRYKPDGSLEPIPGGPKDLSVKNQAIAESTAIKGKLIADKIDEALNQVSDWSTGFTGGVLGKVPGTDAYNLDKTLDTIKANIGFNELQAMRQASPTGGALGQVAVRELDMLQATLGSLDKGQDSKQLKSNLERVQKHYQNWKKAVDQAATQEGGNAIPQASAPEKKRQVWNPVTKKIEER